MEKKKEYIKRIRDNDEKRLVNIYLYMIIYFLFIINNYKFILYKYKIIFF